MLLWILLLPSFLYLNLASVCTSAQKLETVYEWKYIDYLWDNENDKIEALESGDFDIESSVIFDSVVAKNGRVFVTVLRDKGVPASLATVSSEYGYGGPLLKPYPNWSWSRKGDCSSITSVYRIAIDECNRLWVVDSGNIAGHQACSPELLVFNLTDDQLLQRVELPHNNIPQNSTLNRTLYVTPIVETTGHQCETTHVYISDAHGYGLVVYNGTSVWRLNGKVYKPQVSAMDVEIAGQTFHTKNGIFGMALSPEVRGVRSLLFSAYASYDVVSVRTQQLQDPERVDLYYSIAHGILQSQSAAMAFTSAGVLLFGLSKEMGLGCWNMNEVTRRSKTDVGARWGAQRARDLEWRETFEHFSMQQKSENKLSIQKDIADQDNTTLRFISGLKVLPGIDQGHRERIWMVTNNYQKVVSGTQNLHEINYRILMAYVDDVVADTECAPWINK